MFVSWHDLQLTRRCSAGILVFVLWLASGAAWAAGGTLVPGSLGVHPFFLYLPAGYDSAVPAPLVVVLHGCRQNAAAIAQLTRFNDLADTQGFLVLYPQTGPALDNPRGCWRWWEPRQQQRNGPEPRLVVDMVDQVKRRAAVDADRVYVAGLSSGAALAVILGSVYPDLFAATGAHSGLEFAAAATGICALEVMGGDAPAPGARGALAYLAQGRRHRVAPLIVVQGESDPTVEVGNSEAVITQFAAMNDYADDGDGSNGSFDATADAERLEQVPDGHSYRVQDYEDGRGRVTLRRILVADLGHAWSGGPAEAAFSDPAGPDATAMMWAFFKERSLTDPPIQERPAPACSEHYGTNAMHYWWYRNMDWDEYWCDPWSMSWRHGFGQTWGPGRCP